MILREADAGKIRGLKASDHDLEGGLQRLVADVVKVNCGAAKARTTALSSA